jgi:polyferredoxin
MARRAARQGQGRENLGDCIDCNACVNVCPVGIDIRDGQQLECITCALCIDACDDIMDKVGKPRGLIDYIALTDERASARAGAALDLEACLPPAHDHLHDALVGGWHRPDGGAVHPLGHRRDGGAGAQPAIRDAVGRVDPQHL